MDIYFHLLHQHYKTNTIFKKAHQLSFSAWLHKTGSNILIFLRSIYEKYNKYFTAIINLILKIFSHVTDLKKSN